MKIRNILMISIVLTAVLLVGAGRYEKLQVFSKVLNFVEQYYVENVDTKKLVYGAIKGMLSELDPHTNFLPPEMYNEFQSETSGEFGGVGIEITLKNGALIVISPIEDTPAWKAGVQSGDRIVSINGASTKGLSLAEAAQMMRGKTGEKVKLGILRNGIKVPKIYEMVRAKVKIRSVKATDLGEGYLYVKITSFIEKTYDDLLKIIKRHQKDYTNVKGMIIDLRNNPGGLLDQAVKISDLFLTEGTIVSTIGRNKKDKEVVYAKSEGTLRYFPVILLVNEYSASASEILAGALQDNQRGVVMGRRSFGKGSVQSVIKLEDGSALKLTVARYYTPRGVSIQAKGISPDIVIDRVNPEAYKKAVINKKISREGDMRGALKSDENSNNVYRYWAKRKNTKTLIANRDKLLKEDFEAIQAYNYLRAWRVFKTFKKDN